MAKTIYVCQNCSWQGVKWQGLCPQCNTWNSIVEEAVLDSKGGKTQVSLSGSKDLKPLPFSEISSTSFKRFNSGIKEFDRIVGGGLVPGSFVLLGGDPGIGKSTLLLQVSGELSQSQNKVLYVSAEESASQTALRAKRLNIDDPNLLFCSESSLEDILKEAKKIKPSVLIIDSIQTVYLKNLSSSYGTVSQIRECAGLLMNFAKAYHITVIIVGHVTKEGNLAGPKVLEHLVDVVLSFEGDSHYQFRILRSSKNRFGSTKDLAVFEMSDTGLNEVNNPSSFFLKEKSKEGIGSTVFTAMEGSRPILCEIQSLVVQSYLSLPRRTVLGLDVNRIHMIVAVLDKYLGADLGKKDIFVNLVGGLKISEPASDLAVAISILSSLYKKSIPQDTCFFGELGLTGELRSCHFPKERVLEAEKLGFKQVYLSHSLKGNFKNGKHKIKLHFKDHLEDFANFLNS